MNSDNDRSMPARDIALMATGEPQGRVTILRLEGEYDLARRGEVSAQFASLDGNAVCIDFSEVTYIDSTILRELAELRLRDQKRAITLIGVNAHIRHIFDVVNFNELFNIAE
jgi:anti-anti-sigma factor